MNDYMKTTDGMKRITLADLSKRELAELRFCVESLDLHTPEQLDYIYNNLYRDDDGLAFYYMFFSGKADLTPLYVY